MNNLEKLASLRQETAALCEKIMANPGTGAEFAEAFRARDMNYVESMMDGMNEEESADYLAELSWETGCGCNGTDSPFHTYFGMESDSDRSGLYEPQYESDSEEDSDWE